MYGAPAEQKIWKTDVTFLCLTSILLNRLSYIENVDRAGISWNLNKNVVIKYSTYYSFLELHSSGTLTAER